MSYESKIYIVRPYQGELKGDCGLNYAATIAIFKLGYVDNMYDFAKQHSDASCYIYADDGETEIAEDRYGKPLKEIPIRELVFELDRVNCYSKRCDLTAVIAALLHYAENSDDLVALHYGY